MKIYACLAVALAAVASSGRTVYHVNCAGSNNYWYYYDENGVSKTGAQVASDKGEYDIWISRMSSGNRAYSATLSPYMFRIDGTNVTTSMTGPWCDGGGVMTIGAGGVTMGANNMIRFGNKSSGNPFVRFKLAESQTWSGPASGTVWSEFAIGCREDYYGYYWQTCAQALKDLTWTLDGRIKVILTATNDLSNVDVVVNPMARLILVEKYSNQTFGGALGAKTLTLKGGDAGSTIPALTIGGKANPSTTAVGSTTSPVAFSDITVAPKVYLQDGAAVEGGNVEYSVGELFVSGGDSTFSGNVAVKKNVVIDVASGASITFSGAVTSDDGAAIDATGQGTIAFTASTLDAALTGGGAISFSPTSGECVLRGDLSAFTGTVYVASGSLLIHPRAIVNPAATFTAAAGASYKNIEDSELGADCLLDGRDYYRDLNGEPHPYLYTKSVTSNANWPASGFFYYISPDGVTTNWVNWADGSVVCFEHRLSAGLGSQAPMHLCGLVRRASSGATTT